MQGQIVILSLATATSRIIFTSNLVAAVFHYRRIVAHYSQKFAPTPQVILSY